MPKANLAYLNMISNTPTVPFSGTLIEVHSLPADRLSVTRLDAITAYLGTMYAGTLYAGAIDGAHLAVGDGIDGLELTDDTNIPWIMLRTSTHTARLGRVGTDGMDIAEGLVHMHGNCIIDKTLKAAKIDAGEISTRFLDTDVLVVGNWTEDNLSDLTGIKLDGGGLGGYSEGRLRAGFDLGSGIFETRGFVDLEALYNFVKMYDAGIEISGMGDRDPLTFTLWKLTGTNPDNPKEFGIARHVGIDVDDEGFVFYNIDSNFPPRIALQDTKEDENPSAYLAPGTFYLSEPTGQHGVALFLAGDTVVFTTPAGTNDSLYIQTDASTIRLGATGIAITAPLFPDMSATIPAAPEEGSQWYNRTAHRWQTWNGTYWQYPTMNNV